MICPYFLCVLLIFRVFEGLLVAGRGVSEGSRRFSEGWSGSGELGPFRFFEGLPVSGRGVSEWFPRGSRGISEGFPSDVMVPWETCCSVIGGSWSRGWNAALWLATAHMGVYDYYNTTDATDGQNWKRLKRIEIRFFENCWAHSMLQ